MLLQLQVFTLILTLNDRQQGITELHDVFDRHHRQCVNRLEPVMPHVGRLTTHRGSVPGHVLAGIEVKQLARGGGWGI